LLLRRQSMMGDALSHTSLLGIVLAFLLSGWVFAKANIASHADDYNSFLHWMMFAGAIVVGVLAAFLTEANQKLGRVEATAALGVVFTTMFAMGLLLMRLIDHADVDPNCVLYGSILDMVYNRVAIGDWEVPRALLLNAMMLSINLFLVVLFFKELRLSTFDPELATALGLNASLINYVLMAVTASTIVSVFESVGSIIVIAMLIVPAATAYLLTSRLEWMIPLSLVVALFSAIVGHGLAISVPPVLFSRLGFENVQAASTTGMMAATSGGFFFLALVFAPKQGLVSRTIHQSALSLKVAMDDLLGLLYRMEELDLDEQTPKAPALLSQQLGYRMLIAQLAVWKLRKQNKLVKEDAEYHLTPEGRERARGLVRAHRLWESYMAHHFNLSDERLHQSAHRIEHYLDPSLREDLAMELQSPTEDPHGRTIPEEQEPPSENTPRVDLQIDDEE
ncbi:MAG: metal ABC transporter permease, partial [Planctomycetaceae bacterium]|nr:metal ABC transporter permease [Planctomycetaceae bacterium]